jgi:hypothetical protein
MKLSKLAIVCIALFSSYGCTYTAKPHPITPDMVSSFRSDASLQLKNLQTTETAEMDNLNLKFNLKETTKSAIELLEGELLSFGVKTDPTSTRSLGLSIDKLRYHNYFLLAGCTVTMTVETGSGLKKTINEQNNSGLGIMPACDYAITMAVANVLNDSEIRNYITTGSSSSGSVKEKLTKIKELLDAGLITIDEYNEKKATYLKSL